LTTRIKELAERYENKLVEIDQTVEEAESKVTKHLEKMGLVWS